MIIHSNLDGWVLEEMDWDPELGVAYFTYEHPLHGIEYVTRPQPTNETHIGWHDPDRNRTETVLTLTERDWLRYERGIMGYADPVEDVY